MLLKNDIVEECNSEWSSNLVVVRKKDGTPRMCVDLRRVNIATRFDCFPLAKIDESLHALGGAKYMSTLDNSSFLVNTSAPRGQGQDCLWDKITRAAQVQANAVWTDKRYSHIR